MKACSNPKCGEEVNILINGQCKKCSPMVIHERPAATIRTAPKAEPGWSRGTELRVPPQLHHGPGKRRRGGGPPRIPAPTGLKPCQEARIITMTNALLGAE